jgi:hypothetical protein
MVYDIENAPSLGWVWSKYQTDVVEFEQDWFLLSYAYKWLGEQKVHSVSLPDFSGYARDRTDDRRLARSLWEKFDEADIVVAHNGNRFDQAKARARFLVHGFEPPSPFKEVDTLQVARRHFNFTSNALDDLCRQLGIGCKVAHYGFRTWKGCMSGDPKAWALLNKYNRQDVRMLEELYLRLLPWIDGHPNMALIADKPNACPKCGSLRPMKSNGWKYANVTKKQAWRCRDCGGNVYGRAVEKSPVRRVS